MRRTDFPSPSLRANAGRLPRRRRFLIVCEGEKTEPLYFEAIKRILPPHMIERIAIHGTGMNTETLLEKAEKIVEELHTAGRLPYYVWLVFDRDSFPADDFDNTIKAISGRNNPARKTPPLWFAAWSNEAFELWYLLHFAPQTGGEVSREVYQRKLEVVMRKNAVVPEDWRYKKNDPHIFGLLAPFVKTAFKNAASALALQEQDGKSFHQMNPATTVHLLVEELLEYYEGIDVK